MRIPSPPAVRVASTLDTLLILSRSLPIAKPGGILPDALDVLLAGIGCARGIAYRANGGALELAGERGLSRPLRASLERLPLDRTPWFAAQRAAIGRKAVVDRDPAASAKGPLDRAAMAFSQWAHVVACPIAERDLHGVLVFAWPEGEEPVLAALAVVEIACSMIAARLARRGGDPRRADGRADDGRVVNASTLGILASAFAEDLDGRLAEVERCVGDGQLPAMFLSRAPREDEAGGTDPERDAGYRPGLLPAEPSPAPAPRHALAAARRSAARFLAALRPAPPAVLDLVALLDDVLALAAPRLRRGRVDVALDAAGEHRVVGRRAELMQLFIQLVLGAAGALDDTSEPGSDQSALVPRAFRLEVRRRGRNAVASMRDEEAGARSSFFDLVPAASRDLALAHRIALAHEGRLELEPEAHTPDGAVAHFTVALPAVAGEIERRAARPTVARGPVPAPARPVLVWIDGDDLFLEIMVHALPELDVRVAGSAAEAMQLFSFGVAPALVLCNLHLPDSAGHELHAEVERRSPYVGARFVFVADGAPAPEIAGYLVVSGCPTLMRPIDVDQVRALALRDAASLALPAAAPTGAIDAGAQTLPDPRRAANLRLPPVDAVASAKPALREQELVVVAAATADALRREGPRPGAAVGAMLRERGLSHHEALSVLSFALSKGILVRDAPPSTLLRAPEGPAGGTVLVVDDDFDLRETVREILQDEGYKVETTANGREALDRLQRRAPPRVLVLDLMMPVMDGWQLLEELGRDASLAGIPVVVISAGNGRLRGVRSPLVHEFMSKPLDYHKLVMTIDRSMRGRAGAP